jgi:sugar lactone lactonase YvrE
MTTETNKEPLKPFYYIPDKKPMILGEGCTYRASDSTLHWVDCDHSPPRIFILKVDPDTGRAIGEARIVELPSDDYSVTVLSFRKNHPGSYICAYWQGVCTVDEVTGQVEVLKEIFPYEDRKQWRFNDGAIDAKGRFWLVEIDKVIFGMGLGASIPEGYGRPRGKLWRYDPDGSLHCMLDGGIICGNGIGWSPDNRTSESLVSFFFSSFFSLPLLLPFHHCHHNHHHLLLVSFLVMHLCNSPVLSGRNQWIGKKACIQH